MKNQNTHPSHNTEINPQQPVDAEPLPQDDPTIGNVKGTGELLFGKGDFAADGSYIAIRWFSIAYIPLIPLSGYFLTAVTLGRTINHYEGIKTSLPKSQFWFIALHALLWLSFLCALFYLPFATVKKTIVFYICAYALLVIIKLASEKIALNYARKHSIQRNIKKILP